MLSYLLVFLVGLVFLLSSLVKINDSLSFVKHIVKLKIISSNKYVKHISVTLIGMETCLSFALIFNCFPAILIPATIGILLFFIFLTYWSTSTGRVEDCGCYGGILAIEPKASMMLDVIYILMLVTALFLLDDPATELWQWIPAVAVLVVTPFIANKSVQKSFFNLSKLKHGKKWKKNWISYNEKDITKGEYFLVFLGKSCPYCKRWVPLMNIMNTQRDLPTVLGLMELDENEIAQFKSEHLIKFPVHQLRKVLWNIMITAVPTAVLLKDGVIVNKWEGELPEEYALRIKEFYDSIIKAEKKSVFGG